MALGSQAARVDVMSGLTGLTHDIFVGSVVKAVKRESPTADLFTNALPQGDYRLEGQNMVFATDLRFANGAVESNGYIPDHVGLDAVQGKITPVRRYRRVALDNLVEKQASGPGAFEDIGTRLFDILWDSWGSMEKRHAIGASSGVVCVVSSRTSSTVWVAKDGYNHVGTNPIQHLSEGTQIGWYDVSASQTGGAGAISSINYSTNAVTMDSATTWETNVGNQIAAGDLIYFSTTNSTTNANFNLARNYAPNGVGTILDPDAGVTTVFNISQSTYQRWKPYRKTSSTFDHFEVSNFFAALLAKRGSAVSPETDVVVSHPGPVRQLARTMIGFQQQAYTGEVMKGGYTGVTVDGVQFLQDPMFYHDVIAVLNKPSLFRVTLSGDADFWAEDGGMWRAIEDYDGKQCYVVDYMNYFSPARGMNGALTGITTADETDSDYDVVPNF